MITCLGLGSGMDSSLCMGPLGHFPIRVWWKILSLESFHPHPWGGWSGTLWADWVSTLLLSSLSPRGKRPSQLLLHPKHPSFTLRPCDARLGFWPGDCWRWKGSTGQLKFCNNMTLTPADLSCLLPSSWRFWSLFLRLCRSLIMVRVTLWVRGRVHSSMFACWTSDSRLLCTRSSSCSQADNAPGGEYPRIWQRASSPIHVLARNTCIRKHFYKKTNCFYKKTNSCWDFGTRG